VESVEVVDDMCVHLGTNVGVFLINVNQFTFNGIQFTNSTKALTYITNN
jgi:hypothetical protein